jgi:putative drug exporter of the RND superfamily
VRYKTDPSDIEKDDGEALIAAGETAEKGGVDFAARGLVIDVGSEQDAPVGELLGIFIAIFLLWALFRSWVAMVATLVGALIGVATGQTLLVALAAGGVANPRPAPGASPARSRRCGVSYVFS